MSDQWILPDTEYDPPRFYMKEIYDDEDEVVIGVEFGVWGEKAAFIIFDQKLWTGIRAGTFPSPDWNKKRYYTLWELGADGRTLHSDRRDAP